jgi:hypothetical protein
MVDGSRPSPGAVRPRRLIRAPQDFAGGVCLLVVALFALWASAELDAGRLRAMGPGMLPRAIAVLLGLAGVALLVLSFLKEGEALGRWPLRGPLFVTLGVLAFAVTIRTAGLVVAGPLVAVVSGAASPETRMKELIPFALVVTAFCIGLFRYALHLPIPILIIPGVLVI